MRANRGMKDGCLPADGALTGGGTDMQLPSITAMRPGRLSRRPAGRKYVQMFEDVKAGF